MASNRGWAARLPSRRANDILTVKNISTIGDDYRSGEIPVASDAASSERTLVWNHKISLIRYDITKLRVDAIVNAANSRLQNGSGVNGAVHEAAGHSLMPALAIHKGCETGSAKVTEAFELPCKRIIHAVGPVFGVDFAAKKLLRSCYRTSLELAAEHKFKTIAFSCISTGVYEYPSDEAAKVAVNEAKKFFESGRAKHVDRIIFCCFDEKDLLAYQKVLP